MHYWNKASFDGLVRLSESLETNPNLQLLANYCRLREQGLRREAFSALERFLTISRSFDSATARSSAVEILESNARTREAHQFLTQPLVTRFLMPTLRTWSDDNPGANVPIRWLGMLCRDHDLLARALAMCPEDIPVRKLLIERHLSDAEYATHHLDEGHFIGDIDQATAALDDARVLIANAPEAKQLGHLVTELHYFDTLIADWKSYLENRIGSFPEWCAKQGRRYDYPIKIYYRQ